MKATLRCRSCRSILLLICLVKSKGHKTRKDAKKTDKERKRKQARMPLLYHHTKCIPLRGPHRTGSNSKIQMTNQIHTNKTARTMKYSDEDENNEQTTTERKAQSRHTHKKRSVLLLQQQIILHCNSLQFLSIPTHTARQGSQCSDKRTARCNKSYIKKTPQRVQQQRTAENTNTGQSKQATPECGVHCCFSPVPHFA